MDAHFETLAAWADGEHVDRAAVLDALGTDAGREYVVDLMALRHLVTTTPMSAYPAVTEVPTQTPQRRRRWPALVAAAAAMVCVAGGYAIGRLAAPAPASSEADVIPVVAPSTSAPAPTHVIRFEAGVDWRETVGGN